jgi:hypothetical protein
MRRRVVEVLVVPGALLVSACGGPTVSNYDLLRTAASDSRSVFLLRDVGPGASRASVVVLVGENHASVAAQRELATLIDRLAATKAVSAILVEGSSGPISTDHLRRSLERRGLGDLSALNQHWLQLLDSGDIGAYEYALLTNPAVEGVGVEDMDAKARHEAELNSDEHSWSFVLELHRRAYARLARIITSAGAFDSIRRPAALAAVDRVGAALARAEWALQNWQRARAPSLALRKLHALVSAKLRALTAALQRDEPSRRELLATYESPRSEASDLQERLFSLQAEWERVKQTLEPKVVALVHAIGDLEDAFFIAANAVHAARVPLGRETTLGVESAYRDETKRLTDEEHRHLSEHVEMQARNLIIVDNTLRYLEAHPNSGVMLIVGDAHLDGLARELLNRQISVLSGALPSNEKGIEPWEAAAWERRRNPSTSVFSAPECSLKELSRLLDPRWISAETGRLQFFRAIREGGIRPTLDSLAGDGRVYEHVNGRDLTVHVSRIPIDRNADVGRHIVERGVVPGSNGESYEVTDREVARTLVKDLSGPARDFAYVFQTNGESGPSYAIETARGRLSADDFFRSLSRPDAGVGHGPKTMVLFGEADDVPEGTLTVSPFWQRVRTELGNAGIGGRGSRKIPNGRVIAAVGSSDRSGADDGHHGSQQTRVYRTLNPERASLHLDLLGEQTQRRDRGRYVTFVSEADLRRLDEVLRFTPTRGDFSQVVLLVTRNVSELREAVKRAAESRKLKNKQVALVTCGDAFRATGELREAFLRSGALMVWTLDRQITPQAGRRLVEYAKTATAQSGAGHSFETIEHLMAHTLERWSHDAPADPAWKAFTQAATWVLNRPSDPVSYGEAEGW